MDCLEGQPIGNVETNFTAFYAKRLLSTAIKAPEHNLVNTFSNVKNRFLMNTLHCKEFVPSVSTDSYSPCSRLVHDGSGFNPSSNTWTIRVHPRLYINMTFGLESLTIACYSPNRNVINKHCGEKQAMEHMFLCMNNTLSLTYTNTIQVTPGNETEHRNSRIYIYYEALVKKSKQTFVTYDSLPHMAKDGLAFVTLPVALPMTIDVVKNHAIHQFSQHRLDIEIFIITAVFNRIKLYVDNDVCARVVIHDGPSKWLPTIAVKLTLVGSILTRYQDATGFAALVLISMDLKRCQTLPTVVFGTGHRGNGVLRFTMDPPNR